MALTQFIATTPNEMLLGVRNFLVENCGFTVIKDISDDLDIATQTFVDGQLCVLKDPIDKYYISIRSANHYHIWGNSYTVEEDSQAEDNVTGLGIMISPSYNSSSTLWYNQDNAPLYFKGGCVVRYGANLSCKTAHPFTVYCNYTYDGDSAYTCLLTVGDLNGHTNISVKNFDRRFYHAMFGNLLVFNKKNIDTHITGGFVMSNQLTRFGETGDKSSGTRLSAQIPQPNANYYSADLFTNTCFCFVNIPYGDYIKPYYTKDTYYTDVVEDNLWATTSPIMGGNPYIHPNTKDIPIIVLPLSDYTNVVTGISYSRFLGMKEGNANTNTYDCKTFGLPLIIGIVSNPVALNEVEAVGEVYGVYFISTYNSIGGSLHAIKTYDGLVPTQIFPSVLRWIPNYIGIAIKSSYAEDYLGDSLGGELGL